MTGGLLQITSSGSEDLFLTGTPQITYFKIVYRRHTNFACEIKITDFPDKVDFGSTSKLIIDKYGDLISHMYLSVELPYVNINKYTTKPPISKSDAEKQLSFLDTFHQMINNFLDNNTDMARNIKNLLTPDNVIFDDFIKLLHSNPFKFKLDTSKKQLIDFMESNDLAEIGFDKKTKNDILSHIPTINILGIILGITKNTNPRKIIVKMINNTLYERMRNFYNIFYPIYKNKSEFYTSIINNSYVNKKLFAWTNNIGNNLIDTIDITIGNTKLDQHSGTWLNIFNSLYGKLSQQNIYDKMIGNVESLTTLNNEPKLSYVLYIPLQFWFCRYPGLSIPIISLKYHEISINLKLKNLIDVAYFSSDDISDNMSQFQSKYQINLDNTKLYTEYIFLDTVEHKRFAESSHEYLVETVHEYIVSNIFTSETNIKLRFSHPTKYIVWYAQPESYTQNLSGKTNPLWNKYSLDDNKSNIFESTYIQTNLVDRTDPLLGPDYYNLIQPLWHFNRSIPSGLNIYSFALNPMQHQPSGSINLSRLTSFNIRSIFSNEIMEFAPIRMVFYTVSYNVLRFMSGMGGFAFQYEN